MAARLWCCVALVCGASARLIASSKVTRCVDSAGNTTCGAYVLLTVGLQDESEDAQFVTTVADESGTQYNLSHTVHVSATAGPSSHRYLLTRFSGYYDEAPSEVFVVRDSSSCGTCEGIVPTSDPAVAEGLCCPCDLCSRLGLCDQVVLGHTCRIGVRGTSVLRCYKESGKRWAPYTIEPATLAFSVNVTVRIGNVTEVMELSASSTRVRSSNRFNVEAYVHGSLEAREEPLSLTKDLLLWPEYDGDAKPLLVASSAVAHADSHQSLGLLGLRPQTYYQLAGCKHTAGALPTVQSRGIDLEPLGLRYSRARLERRSGPQERIISILMPADDVVVTVTAAQGTIVAVDHGSLTPETGGSLAVTVRNTDAREGSFVVEVSCDADVHVRAVQVAVRIPALSEGQAPFSAVPAASGDFVCAVSLLDANLFTVLDTTRTNITVHTRPPQPVSQPVSGNQQSGSTTIYETTEESTEDGCTACPWYSPMCFLGRRCFLQLVIRIGLFVGIGVGVCICFKCGIARSLYDCLRPSKSRDRESDSESEEPRRPRRRRRRRARRARSADARTAPDRDTAPSTPSETEPTESSAPDTPREPARLGAKRKRGRAASAPARSRRGPRCPLDDLPRRKRSPGPLA